MELLEFIRQIPVPVLFIALAILMLVTIVIAIQYMKGSYGRVDMGAVMAALILAVIPVIIFYLSCQKHIIKGVAAGAVKGQVHA